MGNMIKDLNKSKTVQKQILKEAKIKALKNTFARQIDLYYDSVKKVNNLRIQKNALSLCKFEISK